MKARYWKRDGEVIVCLLCPQNCRLREGKRGFCAGRRAEKGQMAVETYGRIAAMQLDPIEKKPLSRFHPGSSILSVGSYGCNLRCANCQNWSISSGVAPTREMTVSELVEIAESYKAKGNIGLAYTYAEAVPWFEFVLDCAREIRRKGMQNLLVTNAYAWEDPFREMVEAMDAMNVDLKSFRSEFYAEVCGGKLEPVLRNVETAAKASHLHLEVTTLIIPGLNDSEEEIDELARFLADLSPEIPWHLSRFFPSYRMTEVPETPRETMRCLEAVAKRHMKHVFLGNI